MRSCSRRTAHARPWPGARAGWSAIKTMFVLTVVVFGGGSVIAYFVLGDGSGPGGPARQAKSGADPIVEQLQVAVPEIPLSGSPLGPLPVAELGSVTPLPLEVMSGVQVPIEAEYTEQPMLSIPDVLVGTPPVP
jgi:hypothetical protein